MRQAPDASQAGPAAVRREDPRRQLRRLALLDALGHPEARLRVVHIAGTNGKGSVAAMLAAGLTAAHRRVGLFTSPDLSGPRERFRLGGEPISSSRLEALEARIAPAIAAIEARDPGLGPMGAFERWCALAWVWLAEEQVELAVVEAGVGARFDATNVFARPELTLVSSIGLDHADRLGTDLEGIARDKAGAFRSGVPALTSASGLALEVLRQQAALEGLVLEVARPLTGAISPRGGWEVELPPKAASGPSLLAHLALAGGFQLENAGLAVAALRALDRAGWEVPDTAIARGLSAVVWPGRMESLPDPTGGDWLLDGAHNAPAVEALMASWGEPAVVVAGIQTTKDAAAMVPNLTAGGRPLVALPVPGAMASWSPEALAGLASGPFYAMPDLPAALALARTLAPGGRRCVTGSLYVVGAARACLLQGA